MLRPLLRRFKWSRSGMTGVLLLMATVATALYLKNPKTKLTTVSVEPITAQEARTYGQSQKISRSPASLSGEPIRIFELSESWIKTYRFRRELRAKTPDQSLIDFDLRGSITWTKSGEWVRGSFVLESSPETKSTIPFYFKVSSRGELLEIRSGAMESGAIQAPQAIAGSSEEVNAEADQESILKDLALLFAFRTQQDSAGAVELSWKETQDYWVKSKLHYVGAPQNQIRVLSSQHWVARNLTTLAGNEKTELKNVQTESKYQLRLEKTESAERDPFTLGAVLALKRVSIQPQGSRPQLQKKWTWDEVQNWLQNLSKLDSKARMKRFHDLSAALRHQAELLPEFEQWGRTRRGEGLQGQQDFQFALGVLAAVGSPEAQRALRDYYTEQADPAILNSFSLMRTPPDVSTSEFLERLASQSSDPDEKFPALFALGNGLSVDPDNQSALDLIQRRFASTQSLYEKMEVIDAIGNAGHEKLLPLIEPLIRDPNTPGLMLEKAIYSLRRMTSETASQQAGALLRGIEGDPRYLRYRALIQSTLQEIYQR
jgi:hypothetical protein